MSKIKILGKVGRVADADDSNEIARFDKLVGVKAPVKYLQVNRRIKSLIDKDGNEVRFDVYSYLMTNGETVVTARRQS